jgi:hypothetical protein
MVTITLNSFRIDVGVNYRPTLKPPTSAE